MEPLSVSYNSLLVSMSCLVALVAGFTGLSLTKGLSEQGVFQKKVSIALASVALGGGIWSMHFVAMLGLQLPILFYYDAAITLISALTAILIVAAALVLLHFVDRTPAVIASAGAIVGFGVLAMHYIGMAGLELCRAVYTPFGVVLSSIVAVFLCILAFMVAYGRRTNRNIFLGTLCFAAAVCSVHFLAMEGTTFVAEPSVSEFGPLVSNEALAIGVILSSFVLFGTFLWVGVTYLVEPGSSFATDAPAELDRPTAEATPIMGVQVPCERDGGKVFVSAGDVVLVRADGHYTQVYTSEGRLFCVWPITEASKRLSGEGLVQTHRSYLVNLARVTRFERLKDKGRCLFDTPNLPPAPGKSIQA